MYLLALKSIAVSSVSFPISEFRFDPMDSSTLQAPKKFRFRENLCVRFVEKFFIF